jgi:hypothetical protein
MLTRMFSAFAIAIAFALTGAPAWAAELTIYSGGAVHPA